MISNIENYKFYSINYKERNILYLIVNNQNEVRILQGLKNILLKDMQVKFFYFKPNYCIELTFKGIKSKHLFQSKDQKIILDEKDVYGNVMTLLNEKIFRNAFVLLEILDEKDLSKSIFTLLRSNSYLLKKIKDKLFNSTLENKYLFDNQKKFKLYKEFNWEKCIKPQLINKLVYGWHLFVNEELVELLTTTDGMVKVSKRNFITKKDNIYKVLSKYLNSFLECEIILQENHRLYTKDAGFYIEEELIGFADNMYVLYYKQVTNKDSIKLMYFSVTIDNLEIKENNIVYTGDYWVELAKDTFYLPFKIKGFCIEFKNYELDDCEYFEPMEDSVEELLKDFERSENPKIIWTPEEMYYSYEIYYKDSINKDNFMNYFFRKGNQIRMSGEDEDIISINNLTYSVIYSTKKREEFLKIPLEAKFGVLYGTLVTLTKGFIIKICSFGKEDLECFYKLKPVKIFSDL